jgi:hypothetical protein
VDFREKYRIEEGNTVFGEDRDGQLTLQQPDAMVDWTAGALAHSAKNLHLTPADMRDAAEQAIADQVWEEMQEIERCRQ